MRYAFIAENRLIFAVRAMCRMPLVHPSGFYAWLREPFSQRALEDQRQTKLIKTAWEESGEVYGYWNAIGTVWSIIRQIWLHKKVSINTNQCISVYGMCCKNNT